MPSVVDYYGVRFLVDPPALPVVLGSGAEQEETEMATRLFGPTDRVLVAGNCTGWSAAWISAHGAQVVALEPNPIMASLAAQSVRVDGQPLMIINAAIGVEDGWAILQPSELMVEYTVDRAGQGQTVPVRGLAGLIQEYQINALCLDIEGGECELLCNLLDQAWLPLEKILIEIHALQLGVDKVAQIEAAITSQGFVETESRTRFTYTEYLGDIPTDEIRLLHKAYRRTH